MGIPKNWDRHKDGDHFTYTIEKVREDDSVIEQVAGANNIIAAKAAYRALPDYCGEDEILRIRQGGRIMDRQRGNDSDRKALLERMRSQSTVNPRSASSSAHIK